MRNCAPWIWVISLLLSILYNRWYLWGLIHNNSRNAILRLKKEINMHNVEVRFVENKINWISINLRLSASLVALIKSYKSQVIYSWLCFAVLCFTFVWFNRYLVLCLWKKWLKVYHWFFLRIILRIHYACKCFENIAFLHT